MSFPSPRFPPQAYPAAPLGDQRNRMRLPTPESEDLDLQTNSSWSGDEAVEFIIGNTGEAFLYSFEECKTRQVCILVPFPRQLSESNILLF